MKFFLYLSAIFFSFTLFTIVKADFDFPTDTISLQTSVTGNVTNSNILTASSSSPITILKFLLDIKTANTSISISCNSKIVYSDSVTVVGMSERTTNFSCFGNVLVTTTAFGSGDITNILLDYVPRDRKATVDPYPYANQTVNIIPAYNSTSSPEQTQTNLYNGFILFFLIAFCIIGYYRTRFKH